jgi:hypothetical protein
MESSKPVIDDQDQSASDRKSAPSRKPLHLTLGSVFATLVTVILGIVILLPLFTAIGIFGYQFYYWAKHGSWIVISFAKFSSWAGLPTATYFTPKAWLGIAKAVQTTSRLPAALVLFVFSVSAAIIGGFFQRR